MTVEVRPLGNKCNLSCTYCYEEDARLNARTSQHYDLDAIKVSIERANAPFILFGGEPLLVPLSDLCELWQVGYERFGVNGIQTNGTLVTDAHIAAFLRFNVAVGISVDGPAHLNTARVRGDSTKTLRATNATMDAIAKLCSHGRPPGLIVTLHKLNASAEQLNTLKQWFVTLATLGVRCVRLHQMEVNSARAEAIALNQEEAVRAFRELRNLERTGTSPRFDVFGDISQLLLLNDKHTACVWSACDPYNTQSVIGIEANGADSNCGRVYKDGVEYAKAADHGYERYLALYHTPQEYNGCRDCRFFLICKGQCPGEAIDGDWRNRSALCGVWKALYEDAELELIERGQAPVSRADDREALEFAMVRGWAAGKNLRLCQLRTLVAAHG